MVDDDPEDLPSGAAGAEDAGEGAAPPPDGAFTPVPNHGLITFFVMAATIMQTIDSTIANVALPKMQGTLSATQDQMAWVLTSYIIASAIMIPLTGWLAGRFGRKKVFLLSIAGFTIASALCGMAMSLPEIVLFRLLQGMSGAALVPLSQAVLFDINPQKNYGKAMALWGIGVTMGPIIGPALGGYLTENYSWRWVFYINVPIGIVAFLGLSAFMSDTKKLLSRFDFFGFITLSVALGAFQMMLDRGELKGWFGSNEIIVEAILAGIAFYLFMVHMFSYSRPFLSPALFKDRNFVTANVFIFMIGIILFATLALLPSMLQINMGYPVVLTGLVTAPRGVGSLVAMLIVGRLIGKIDVRLIMFCGLSLTAFSLWQMTHYNLLMDDQLVITSGILQGLGIGFIYVPLSTVAFATLPSALRNEGTSFFNLVRNIGSAIGISVVQFMLTRNTQTVHATLAEHITPYNLNSLAFGANHIDPTTQSGLLALNGMITNQAAMVGYVDDFKLMMVMTIAVIPLLLILRKSAQDPDPTHVAVMD